MPDYSDLFDNTQTTFNSINTIKVLKDNTQDSPRYFFPVTCTEAIYDASGISFLKRMEDLTVLAMHREIQLIQYDYSNYTTKEYFEYINAEDYETNTLIIGHISANDLPDGKTKGYIQAVKITDGTDTVYLTWLLTDDGFYNTVIKYDDSSIEEIIWNNDRVKKTSELLNDSDYVTSSKVNSLISSAISKYTPDLSGYVLESNLDQRLAQYNLSILSSFSDYIKNEVNNKISAYCYTKLETNNAINTVKTELNTSITQLQTNTAKMSSELTKVQENVTTLTDEITDIKASINGQSGGTGTDNLSKEINAIKSSIGDTSKLNTESKNLSGAVNEVFQNVVSGKKQIAQAINDKGSYTSADNTFSEMAAAIRHIPTDGNIDDSLAPKTQIELSINNASFPSEDGCVRLGLEYISPITSETIYPIGTFNKCLKLTDDTYIVYSNLNNTSYRLDLYKNINGTILSVNSLTILEGDYNRSQCSVNLYMIDDSHFAIQISLNNLKVSIRYCSIENNIIIIGDPFNLNFYYGDNLAKGFIINKNYLAIVTYAENSTLMGINILKLNEFGVYELESQLNMENNRSTYILDALDITTDKDLSDGYIGSFLLVGDDCYTDYIAMNRLRFYLESDGKINFHSFGTGLFFSSTNYTSVSEISNKLIQINNQLYAYIESFLHNSLTLFTFSEDNGFEIIDNKGMLYIPQDIVNINNDIYVLADYYTPKPEYGTSTSEIIKYSIINNKLVEIESSLLSFNVNKTSASVRGSNVLFLNNNLDFIYFGRHITNKGSEGFLFYQNSLSKLNIGIDIDGVAIVAKRYINPISNAYSWSLGSDTGSKCLKLNDNTYIVYSTNNINGYNILLYKILNGTVEFINGTFVSEIIRSVNCRYMKIHKVDDSHFVLQIAQSLTTVIVRYCNIEENQIIIGNPCTITLPEDDTLVKGFIINEQYFAILSKFNNKLLLNILMLDKITNIYTFESQISKESDNSLYALDVLNITTDKDRSDGYIASFLVVGDNNNADYIAMSRLRFYINNDSTLNYDSTNTSLFPFPSGWGNYEKFVNKVINLENDIYAYVDSSYYNSLTLFSFSDENGFKIIDSIGLKYAPEDIHYFDGSIYTLADYYYIPKDGYEICTKEIKKYNIVEDQLIEIESKILSNDIYRSSSSSLSGSALYLDDNLNFVYFGQHKSNNSTECFYFYQSTFNDLSNDIHPKSLTDGIVFYQGTIKKTIDVYLGEHFPIPNNTNTSATTVAVSASEYYLNYTPSSNDTFIVFTAFPYKNTKNGIVFNNRINKNFAHTLPTTITTDYTKVYQRFKRQYFIIGSLTWTVPDILKLGFVDVFCVGGGANGVSNDINITSAGYGAGGGGGYTNTMKNVSLKKYTSIPITIGGQSGKTLFGSLCTAGSGNSPLFNNSITNTSNDTYVIGGSGGSGGGGAISGTGYNNGNGGADGGSGNYGNYSGGRGQNKTTRAFEELTNTLYAGGGGGGHTTTSSPGSGGAGGGGAGGNRNYRGVNGTVNTGGGGGGGDTASGAGSGGSGICIVRCGF